jgi:hypothetical protein
MFLGDHGEKNGRGKFGVRMGLDLVDNDGCSTGAGDYELPWNRKSLAVILEYYP